MPNAIVINVIEVTEGREDAALTAWEAFAEYFRRQPGYVSTKLHRAVGADARFRFINVAEWESADDFLSALKSPGLADVSPGAPEQVNFFTSIYEVIRS
ncbi:MAG TPA: antibiotic biosynthesis monooxygenase family protein [Vicinamibacterales bacterium]|nr:antibiotic biosynthesis monooxygenase family protein [Vicinamibacterales bacterium]